MNTVRQRVQGGMTWLDEHYPDHVERFDPETFHLLCEEAPNGGEGLCVLMQATGKLYWSHAMSVAGLEGSGCRWLGFLPLFGADSNAYRRDAEALSDTWIEAYAERKALIDNG